MKGGALRNSSAAAALRDWHAFRAVITAGDDHVLERSEQSIYAMTVIVHWTKLFPMAVPLEHRTQK
ncbi:hypothetical protein BJF92_06400 [Rhizobium rhizosphaerae]|uniref:Uncharacterized protein n=1 Tax=Xaviernesmea rhizosphaerae TaxID=1672749 RepID=A0A1Q9AP74_9HYPH|nr:hypothetical protein BJF92_06400 [Xaviernesmea rhizosphaerae]